MISDTLVDYASLGGCIALDSSKKQQKNRPQWENLGLGKKYR